MLMKKLLMSASFSGNDSQGSDNDPELDVGGESESESAAESEAMDEVRECMDNMDTEEGEERNDPPENSVRISPTHEPSFENSEGNDSEAMAVEPNPPGL
jgi:hypothetical protein